MYATSSSGAIQYWPHGAIKQMTHANGLVETTTVNNRLQPTAIQASSLLTLGYKYTPPVGHTTPTTVGNNGNIYEQTVTPGTASSMYFHYDYDGLNRIQWASGYDAAGAPDPSTNLTCAIGTSPASAWCHHYSMDAYGNRLIDNRGGLSIPPGEPTAISASTNRATASGSAQWGYDSNGNVMVDGAGNSFTYDAENRLLTGGGAAYAYDGQGQRVTRTLSGGTATFVYDAAGQLAAEYGVAGPASPLGSTRLVTNQSMTPVERVDYLPYGEEMTFTAGTVQAGAPGYGFYAAGDVRQRFTGKERDGETGLDYFGARYFSAVQGRFTSPDWAGTPQPVPYAVLTDPQTLNLYSYVRNNPLSGTDPDGHCCEEMEDFGRQITIASPNPVIKLGGYLIIGAGIVGTALTNPGVRAEAADFLTYASEHGAKSAARQDMDDLSGRAVQQQTGNVPSRGGALNDAKRDADVPTSQQPEKQANAPVTDSNGKQVVVDGKPQTSREYTHTTGSGETVVIQDHSQGHRFPDGSRVGPHFNVRPQGDRRHGTVAGTQPHYPYKKPGEK